MDEPPRVRVRGIYATALSVRCRREDFAITDPSAVLRERLEEPFAEGPPDVVIRDTSDRVGVEVTGVAPGVADVAGELAACSTDTLRWGAVHPRDGVFAVEIEEEAEGGAIARTGAGTAYLPYGKVDGYVSTGDLLLAQVIDPEPPWSRGRRPVLGGSLHARGTHVWLERGADSSILEAPSAELARTVEHLNVDPPEGWGFGFDERAEAIEPGRLRADIDAAVTEAEAIESVIAEAEEAPSSGPITAPRETHWVRFGREGRFACDRDRAARTATVEGHHRLKVLGDGAARAVDLLEAYGVDEVGFDPRVVFDVFGPNVGDRVRIAHGKPTGETIELGDGRVSEVDETGHVTIERHITSEGRYDALETPREAGDLAETTFVEGRWWYPTVYRSAEDDYKGTYVNVGTPIEILPDRVHYVDLFVDVIRRPDGDVAIVDEEELADAVADGPVPESLGRRAREVATAVADAF